MALREYDPHAWYRQINTIDKSYVSEANIEKCAQNFHTRYVKGNLRAMIALCRLHDVVPILMTHNYNPPDMVEPVRFYYARGFDAVNEDIRRTATEEGVLLLDMAREYPLEPGFMEYKFEFTPEGNAVRVRIITEFLERHNLLVGHGELSEVPA